MFKVFVIVMYTIAGSNNPTETHELVHDNKFTTMDSCEAFLTTDTFGKDLTSLSVVFDEANYIYTLDVECREVGK
jgi:hypothetical protein